MPQSPAADTFLSPNFGDRRGVAEPDMIVLHYTAMESAKAACERLCDPSIEVSAHYLISEGGEVIQLVSDQKRAWHAGAGSWGRVEDVNSHSLGIELANTGDAPFSEPQMAALEHLIAHLMLCWAIPPERVIGHSDMAPGRKIDPGKRFDWHRLARLGLAVWPDNSSDSVLADALTFRRDAIRFGYTSSVDDEVLLNTFRMRFRPWGKGVLDHEDCTMMADLAARYPVDQSLGST